MLNPGRFLCLALPLAVLLASPVLHAQPADQDADNAKKLLTQALDEYKALSFSAAKKTLLDLSGRKDAANKKDLKEHLSAADRKALDDTLAKVDPAIREQAAATEKFNSAEDALKKADLTKAKDGYSAAAASAYLDPKVRKDAEARLAEVNKKIELASAAPKPPTGGSSTGGTAPRPPAGATQPVKTNGAQVEEQILAKAQRFMAIARDAIKGNEPDQAIAYANQAKSLVPDIQGVDALLAQARQLKATGGTESILSRIERDRQLALQIANVEFQKDLRSSREAMAAAKVSNQASDYLKADEYASSARNKLETNKTLYSAADYDKKRSEVDAQIRFVQEQRTRWEADQAKVRGREIDDEIFRKERIAREARLQKIAFYKEQVKRLCHEQNYRMALEQVDQILKIEPTNGWASEQKEMIEQFVMLWEEKTGKKTQMSEEQKQFIDVRWTEIPWYEVLKYPKDWKEITARRQDVAAGTASESEDDRLARQRMQRKIPKVHFPSTTLNEAITFLRDVSGVNIFVNWPALLAAGVDRNTQVEVHLEDVTVQKALRTVLETVSATGTQLNYVLSGGVVKVSTKDDLNKETLTRVYDIRDLIVRVPNFAGPKINILDVGQNTGTNNQGGQGLFGQDQANQNQGMDQILTKKELVDQIISTIKETVESKTWAPEGNPGAIRELGGQLIVTHTVDAHERLMNLISQLREQRSIQIAIEARFIQVNTGFLNSIGINLDLFFNIGSSLGSNLIRDAATGNIVGGQVYDPWSGAYVPNKTGTSAWGSGKPGTGEMTPIGVHGPQVFGTGATTPFGNMLGKNSGGANSIGAQVLQPGLSMGGTFLDDIQVDFLIQATQAHTATRVLTAPRLTLFNGQRAYVTVATEQAYVAGYDPLVSENVAASRPIIKIIPAGSVLDIEATVSADRRYVTMTVRPQLNGTPTFTSFAGVMLPTINRQIMESTVSCPDGGTLLMGGQKMANELEQEIGVPLLSKIPIINRAFTTRGMIRDESTLLILIRPRILIQREEEEKAFPTGGI